MATLPFVRRGALLIVVATNTVAQPNDANWNAVQALSSGAEVRIKAGSRTVRCQTSQVTGDALVGVCGNHQETFDRQQVSSVSVKKVSHRKRNALIGLAGGTGAGLGIGIAARSRRDQLQIVPNSAVIAGFTVAGAVVGTIVGVVIPTGGWREIYKK
jgi:hypothetical protein